MRLLTILSVAGAFAFSQVSAATTTTKAAAKTTVKAAAKATVKAAATTAASTSSTGTYSTACQNFLNDLDNDPTLSTCRTLSTLGLQNFALTNPNIVDPTTFLPTLTTYCATPRCADSVYASVFQNFTSQCASDFEKLTAASSSDGELTVDAYYWYLSAPQYDAICTKSSSSTGYCWADVIDALGTASFDPSQKDLWDWSVAFLPVESASIIPQSVLCSSCLEDYANIFNAWYTKYPVTFNLSTDGYTATSLQGALSYAYTSQCKFTLGTSVSVNGSSTSNSSTASTSGKTSTSTNVVSGATSVQAGITGLAFAAILSSLFL